MNSRWSYAVVLYPLVVLVFILGLNNQPILDLPNHTARQFIMSSLLFDSKSPFDDQYWVEWVLKPYILNDLIAVFLMQIASPNLVANIMLYLAFLSLPLGVVAYLRAIDQPWLKIVLCLPFLFYLAFNRYFTIGFTHFLISLGIGFFLLAAAEKNLAHLPNISIKWLLIYLFGAIVLYASHSYGLAVFTIMLTVRLIWERSIAIRKVLVAAYLLAIPPFLVFIQKLIWPESLDSFWVYFAPRAELVDRFFEPFHRFHKLSDILFGLTHLLTILCIWQLITRHDPYHFKDKHIRFQLSSFCLFMILFLCLPVGFMKAWDVDTRVLLPAMIYLVLAMIPKHTSTDQKTEKYLHIFQFSVVTLMFAQGLYVLNNLKIADKRLTDLLQVIRLIPPGKNAFMVDADSARYDPTPHHLSLYVIEQGGNIPTLFAAETNAPFSYFHIEKHRVLPETPSKWYLEGSYQRTLEILNTFDYMVSNRPLSLSQHFAERVSLVEQTDGGALYLINK